MQLYRVLPLLLIACVFLLCSCGQVTQENVSKVHSGMTSAEVKNLLGSPTSSETSSALGLVGMTYKYNVAQGHVEIVFVNDKVLAVNSELK